MLCNDSTLKNILDKLRINNYIQQRILLIFPVEKTVFCENHKSRPLFCPSGTVIAVHDAFYGSTASRARCGTTSSRLNCSEPSAYAIVSSACSNKSSCTLQANASLLGVDPCPGIIKFLEVGYTCKTSECF